MVFVLLFFIHPLLIFQNPHTRTLVRGVFLEADPQNLADQCGMVTDNIPAMF